MALAYSWIVLSIILASNRDDTWSSWYDGLETDNMISRLWLGGVIFATPWIIYSLCCNTGFIVSLFASMPFSVFPFAACVGMVSKLIKDRNVETNQVPLGWGILLTICGAIVIAYFFQRVGSSIHERKKKNKVE